MRRVIALMLLALLLGGGAALYFNFDRLIDRYAPFDLERPPDWFTRYHLYRFDRDPQRCYAALEGAGIAHRPAPPRDDDERGCAYSDATALLESRVSYGSRILLRCPAMAALMMWERQVLMPAAAEHLGTQVRAVRHLGTFACRNINRSRESRLSQHASANAIDIASFTLADGSSVSILRDWDDAGAKSRFLRALRDGACPLFGAVLSPDYNVAHRNHFHFDMGWWRVCG
jgi:hypothetical protein